MSGFSADWLALREPADARARAAGAPALAELLAALGSEAGGRGVLDLGAGSGSNLRHLGPQLPPRWRWTLADHDPALLALAAATPGAPQVQRLDLARDLDALAFPQRGLVTASALLDLVSEPWLAALAGRCQRAQVGVLFALTYDGRTTCKPMDRDDGLIVALVNRHQLGDKGFGPALGPGAVAAAARLFARVGYVLRRVRSDWEIGPQEHALQAALFEGWAQAARELDPAGSGRVEAWRERRLRHLARGRSRLTVGHEDLYGWPAPAA
jgi:SAM-dependent methyltransferase